MPKKKSFSKFVQGLSVNYDKFDCLSDCKLYYSSLAMKDLAIFAKMWKMKTTLFSIVHCKMTSDQDTFKLKNCNTNVNQF